MDAEEFASCGLATAAHGGFLKTNPVSPCRRRSKNSSADGSSALRGTDVLPRPALGLPAQLDYHFTVYIATVLQLASRTCGQRSVDEPGPGAVAGAAAAGGVQREREADGGQRVGSGGGGPCRRSARPPGPRARRAAPGGRGSEEPDGLRPARPAARKSPVLTPRWPEYILGRLGAMKLALEPALRRLLGLEHRALVASTAATAAPRRSLQQLGEPVLAGQRVELVTSSIGSGSGTLVIRRPPLLNSRRGRRAGAGRRPDELGLARLPPSGLDQRVGVPSRPDPDAGPVPHRIPRCPLTHSPPISSPDRRASAAAWSSSAYRGGSGRPTMTTVSRSFQPSMPRRLPKCAIRQPSGTLSLARPSCR